MQSLTNKPNSDYYFANGSAGLDVNKLSLWTPSELGAPLVGWWDAADATTITLATGVSAITDKSGNSRTFAQATAADQPALIANAQNGLSVMRFDGDGDFMETANRVTIRTLILLARWTNTTGDYRHIWDRFTASLYGWHGDTASSGNLLSTFTSPLILNGDKYVNGTLTAGLLNRYTNWTIHGFQTTGNIDPNQTGREAGRDFFGDYAEIIYLDILPSTTQRQLIEGYLAWKWGIQASLPNGHPYKNSAPSI